MADEDRKQREGEDPKPKPASTNLQPSRPSKRGRTWSVAPYGITLADLREWNTEQLRSLAFRICYPLATPEETERLAEKIQHLLPTATDAGQLITKAWCYGLQVIETTTAKNLKNTQDRAGTSFGGRKPPEVIPSSKERVKRFRARRKGWSPEKLSNPPGGKSPQPFR
jgi:hypothetical protein